MELSNKKAKNEEIMREILLIYKKNVFKENQINRLNFYKDNLKGYTKKDFKLKKDGIYFDYIQPNGKTITNVPLFDKIISYDIIQNYQLLDEFWNFDIKTKKYLYDKILNFFIDYMENN